MTLGPQTDKTSSSVVKSADRVLTILQLLAASGGALPAQTIAQRCEIPKSSAHHLLNVMRDRGFLVYRERDRVWSLGSAVLEVAAAYRRSDALQLEAGPVLHDLVDRLGHTAHLAVLRGTEVLYIDKRDADTHGVRLVSEIGARLPAVLTAVGQAILAFQSQQLVADRFANYLFSPMSAEEPADLDHLQRQLDQVRRQGFAHEVGMTSSGISCVAAPVFDRDNEVIASVGATFVTAQADADRLQEIIGSVRLAAAQLSLAMGSRGRHELSPGLQ